MTPITKLLVANRGEIAVRIIRACRELGMRSVAVYSDADARSLHVRLADEAVRIGPPPAAESYLRGDRIIAAAKGAGCDAIHPGYGFLAENADFAEAVAAAGLIFIGPPADAIRKMGSKIEARAIAQQAGVPVVPGMEIKNEELRIEKGSNFLNSSFSILNSIGFPLLIKASAGGGGRGMRVVASADEFGPALESARREARNAFGDDRVYVEKLIEQPRHIEVQVLGDAHGRLVHLFERECSIQRRHQKIVEETPSPFLDNALRRRMGEMAIALARAVNYVNAGTVEFIVDTQRSVYFLEMNTRLQVEHPITESVVVIKGERVERSALDLVQWQLRIARGEALSFGQDDVRQRGHAIECRITAEDPARGFLPVTGRITRVVEPVGFGVRVDSGVVGGSEVCPYYDSLLAKLIVHGETRGDAIRKMDAALRDYAIEGVTTNIAFLRDVVTHPAFRRGDTTTDFIERYFADWPASNAEAEHLEPPLSRRPSFNPWRQRNRFRVGGGELQPGADRSISRAPRRMAAVENRKSEIEDRIVAPMPGLIVDVLVKEGDEVARGATLAVLEAMKMETRLTAPAAGSVQRVNCVKGQTVERGQVLVELLGSQGSARQPT
ncbi:MAG: acetyl-CoA carboxylase biotin carboxylase subunit [Anaerolineae bacterium]|nr:acetyl-CoA carboxylase biotin carboxylase subunit [Anaerolineae bacterium]